MMTTFLASLQGLFLGMDTWSGRADGAISLSDARKFPEIVWVDARSADEFRVGHLPNSVNLREDDWTGGLDRLLPMWEPDQPIVVYCDGKGCETSRLVSIRLRQELGTETIFWLEGGWNEILKEGMIPR